MGFELKIDHQHREWPLRQGTRTNTNPLWEKEVQKAEVVNGNHFPNNIMVLLL